MNRKNVFKWLFVYVLLCVAGITTAVAQSLSIADFSIRYGETKTLTITMDKGNLAAVYGVQTDLTLPAGLQLVDNNVAAVANIIQYPGEPTLNFNPDNGRITIFSLSGKPFGEGVTGIVTFTVKAGADFAGGEVKLANSLFTTSPEGAEVSGTDVTATATLDTSYLVDFNKSIATGSHDFKVASNWGHIVGSGNYDGYGPYYMTYSYKAEEGFDGTGALYAARQYAGDNWGGSVVNDLLVTPLVSGAITMKVKVSGASSSNPSFVEIYKINDDGTQGDLIQKFTADEGYTDIEGQEDWKLISLTLTEEQRIGIRAQYVIMDDFTAENVTIVPEKSLTVTGVMNQDKQNGTSGTNPVFEQQPDGTLKVVLKVALENTGDVDFTAGMEGFSLTPASSSLSSGSKTYYEDATVALTRDLAAGAVDTVDVEFYTTMPTSTWLYWFVRENIGGTTSSQYRYASTAAYEPKFVFRVAEATSTSSLTAAQAYGTISEETTKQFEIVNLGVAPLTIKSITLPEGFTSANAPTAEFTLQKNASQAIDITLPVTTTGAYSGNLTIVYLDKTGAEQTYTLAFSGNVLAAGTWFADFGTSRDQYPEGSVAENGISTDYTYSNGAYDYYIKSTSVNSSYATENNKFITPKLHANAGDQMTFEAKQGTYTSQNAYFVKVYKSTDRKTWGEPIAEYYYNDLTDKFEKKSISFAEEGDYYVAFAIFGVYVDNIIGLTKVDVAHDLYVKKVSWPDASVKSGTSLSKPSVEFIPLTTEAADAYTVKYVCGETVLAEGTPVELTASAKSSNTIAFSWTPTVEQTTVYEGTKVVFAFVDGTTFETETFDLTVTNEPKFHFISSLPSSKWYEPTDVSTPIAFPKTNTADKQTFYVYNWGSAPLTVKSIAMPNGFTATPAEQFVVASFDENDMSVAAQAVEITFSAAEAGEYSGDMVITYVNGAGEDATFTLGVSGTKLDPSKFYANFDGEGDGWPAGSVYQKNISTSNGGTYSAPNYSIYSTSTTDNLFITPKLTAATGDKLVFDAKLYSTYWSEGKVVVYAAATREEVMNAEEGTTRTQMFSVSGQDETAPMTTDWQTFEVPALAGDNYYAFEISNRAYVDEIYGLTVADVAHDWMIASSNIPVEAMQNVAATATVNLLNVGLAAEEADAYTVTLYIDGEAAATGEAVALPMTHKLSDAGTAISMEFRSPKVGTFPVYIEVKAGDYSVATEPVDVTFTEEVALADAIEVGDGTIASYNYAPIDFYNFEQARTSDIVYTAAQLSEFGIKSGDKMTKLAFKGTLTTAKTLANSSLKAWVALKTGDIEWNAPDKTTMTEVTVFNAGEMVFTSGDNWININLPEGIVYDGTSDLRIYLEGGGGGEWVSMNFTYDTDYQNMKWSNNSNMKYNPTLFVTLAAEAATFSGTVKDADGNAIENATVTLVSADNDNVQYTGTTDAQGAYSFNVIQTGRTYNATASAEGFEDATEENISFAEGNQTKDFVLTAMVTVVKGDINNDGKITTADAVAIVNIALGEAAPTADQLAVADMNGDGLITTADAVAVVQLALAEEAPAGAPRVDLSAQNRLSVNAGKVMLSNADEFVAFQMDVTLADDAQLQGVNLSNRMTTHEATYARVDANTWRIIVISMQNDAIMNNSGSLMQLNISGNQEISLSNVEFVDAAARACAVGLGETTGIVGVDADQSDASYYNVGGVRNDNVRKGMNIVRSADGKVKKVFVK
ncbi:MAG: carboxypeptidase regulatory-like domain-containing protein [Prevotella sp.]|nr:carboxypeptidase regulatory-like domain-containing protein [Prevotella sp.]